MTQNDQTHFKNLVAFAARFLNCVRPFWDILIKGLTIQKNEKFAREGGTRKNLFT